MRIRDMTDQQKDTVTALCVLSMIAIGGWMWGVGCEQVGLDPFAMLSGR